jgi:hypothetical protein
VSNQSKCIFCGQPGGSREHIVGKWILNDFGLYSIKSRFGFGNQLPTGNMDEIEAPQPLGGFYTDSVCRSCNNGWMSQLEDAVKPLLSPLLVEPWPSPDRQLLTALFVHSATITRWLLKTACTFGDKVSVQVPDNIRSELMMGRLNPEIMADISCNEQSGLYIGMSRTWACFADGKLDSMEVKGHSFRFVWQLRHLAMRISYFPNCAKTMSKPRYPIRLYPRFGIPPDVFLDGVKRPGYRYKSLEELEHDTIFTPSAEFAMHRNF